MAAYKYPTEEAHQRNLAKRRAYYHRNKSHIRARDNESARLNREKNPERYRKYQVDFKLRSKNTVVPEAVSLETHPDRDLIKKEIERERGFGWNV